MIKGQMKNISSEININPLKQNIGDFNASPLSYHISPYDAHLSRMSQYLSQAIFLEVCTHPKPGLVTRYCNGAHKDMSIFTFAMSSGVLAKAFCELQQIGMKYKGEISGLLPYIREYGKKAEQELLNATHGINTQRGILFSGGILSAVAGYMMVNGYSRQRLTKFVSEAAQGIVENELGGKKNVAKRSFFADESLTMGEKLYRKYGITGIRGEVEKGFPSVINHGLPAFVTALNFECDLNTALVHALIALMSVVEDSNVIGRSNIATAENLKWLALEILDLGSVFSKSGREKIGKLEKYCLENNISPGGSADLLSVTIAMYLLENGSFPGLII